jgi:hypothetical protein
MEKRWDSILRILLSLEVIIISVIRPHYGFFVVQSTTDIAFNLLMLVTYLLSVYHVIKGFHNLRRGGHSPQVSSKK